jgi:endonuclease/exonuclease/phosphatase family metal-dependent hydrolase
MKRSLIKAFIVIMLIQFVFNVSGTVSGAAKTADTLKILSYNVRNCKGLDNVTDYKRVAKIITQINADFVALQELDSVTERSNRVDVLGELARETNLFPTYRASIDFQGGKYGIGILTHEKPLRTEAVPLPGSEEKRSLLLVEMKEFVICCTHFSLTQKDRAKSVEIINQLVAKCQKPIFLAGDLNAVSESPEMVDLAKNWQILNDPAAPTIPADKPIKCIDFVMASKNKKYKFEVINSSVANESVASDHLPVWVKVRIIKD